MKSLLCLFAAVALLCGCNKPAAPARIEFIQFEWKEEEDFNTYLVMYDTVLQTNQHYMVFKPTDVLNRLGKYGWELASSDVKTFILKRARPEQPDYENFVRVEMDFKPEVVEAMKSEAAYDAYRKKQNPSRSR